MTGRVIFVTRRQSCGEDFLARIARLAAARPEAILLREKDLGPEDYENLAQSCRGVCAAHGVELILHTHAEVARRLGADALHLPMTALPPRRDSLPGIARIGCSVHSRDEAVQAEGWGADYLIAGHIFATDSKAGLPPRGVDFLADVCRSVSIPVFAIGGLTPERMPAILDAGAVGACVMSQAMTVADPAALLSALAGRSVRRASGSV